MNTALHLPLLEIVEGGQVECIRNNLKGRVLEVFSTKRPKTSKCPITTWYRVRWSDKTWSWRKRKQLIPR